MDLCQKGFSLLRGLREESKNDGWGRLVSHQVRRVMSPMFAGGNSFTDDWSADSLHWLTNEIALETFPSSAISSCKIWLQTHPASDSVLGHKQLIMIVIENFFFWRRLDLIGWWHVKERKKEKNPLWLCIRPGHSFTLHLLGCGFMSLGRIVLTIFWCFNSLFAFCSGCTVKRVTFKADNHVNCSYCIITVMPTGCEINIVISGGKDKPTSSPVTTSSHHS